MPEVITVGSALVSIGAAVGTAILAYTQSRALERKKNEYQRELEELKTQLQGSLEDRKYDLQRELEQYKANIADENATKNARRVYEYDARKRLYNEVEPLLFQLFEAAESALHAVVSLARTERNGHLPEWLSNNAHPYYIRSIIHRLFRPLAVFRLLQRSTTLVDLNLDPTIRLRYSLLKECYVTWTDDFGLAGLAPRLTYDPSRRDWQEGRRASPAVHWRQSLVIGDLDRLIDSMAVSEGTKYRAMNFGEFDTAVSTDSDLRASFGYPFDIFQSFSFKSRPVLARLLLVYAVLLHVLMALYAKPKTEDLNSIDATAILEEFLASEDCNVLNWNGDKPLKELAAIKDYAYRRVAQAARDGYVKF